MRPTATDRSQQTGFVADLVRQICLVSDDGDFVDYAQVHAEIAFAPNQNLDCLGADVIFSEETSPANDAFFAEVESSVVWRAFSGEHPIVAIRVYHDLTE